jgi:hypothetical protein
MWSRETKRQCTTSKISLAKARGERRLSTVYCVTTQVVLIISYPSYLMNISSLITMQFLSITQKKVLIFDGISSFLRNLEVRKSIDLYTSLTSKLREQQTAIYSEGSHTKKTNDTQMGWSVSETIKETKVPIGNKNYSRLGNPPASQPLWVRG